MHANSLQSCPTLCGSMAITICQAPLRVLTTHNINQISLRGKMVMLSSFQLLWSLCTRALWTWSLVWGERGWLILRRKVTSSTSFVKPPVYVCVARVLCICVSIKGLGYLLIQFSHSVMSDSATPWTAACQASLKLPGGFFLKLLQRAKPGRGSDLDPRASGWLYQNWCGRKEKQRDHTAAGNKYSESRRS